MNLFFAIIMILSTAYADTISHLKVAQWKSHTPDVVLCNNINIDQADIEEAIRRWEARGHKIGKIVRKSCKSRPSHGEIAIYEDNKVTGSSLHGAAMRTVYSNTRDIAYARIWLRSSNLNSVKLLEHELGHGLGYKDTSDTSSIMSDTSSIY